MKEVGFKPGVKERESSESECSPGGSRGAKSAVSN